MIRAADMETLGELTRLVEAKVAELDAREFVPRLWRADPELYPATADRSGVQQRLGWLALPESSRATALPMPAEGPVLLIGMGGSSLGAEALCGAVGERPLHVLDSTVPGAIREVLAAAQPLERATVVVASKSGTTLETIALASYVESLATPAAWVTITDPGSPLARRVPARGASSLWSGHANVGGRFSVLSAFGLVPAALAGADLEGVIAAARAARRQGRAARSLADDPAARLGVILAVAAEHGVDTLELHVSEALAAFADWIEQLVAESTGKDGRGVLPLIAGPATAPRRATVHVAIELAGQPLAPHARQRLAAAESQGHPVVRYRLDAPDAIGAEFLRWEVATAAAGAVLGVNPFDEPDVAAAKRRTKAMLDGGWPAEAEAEVPLSQVERLRRFLEETPDDHYIALLAYLAPRRWGEAVARLRQAIERSGRIVTVGWGPRYLHSTGQLHKGGAERGTFLILTDDEGPDLPIPDRAYGFAALVRAQALGDREALRERGRRVLHLGLAGDASDALDRVAAELEAHP